MLMGVRLYSPSIGRFLTVDPVFGGNPNAYVYPADPVNAFDLDGRLDLGRWWNDHGGKVLTGLAIAGAAVCVFASAGACMGALAVGWAARSLDRTYRYGFSNSWRTNLADGVVTGLTFGIGQGFRLAAPRVVQWAGARFASRPSIAFSRWHGYVWSYRAASMTPYYYVNWRYNRHRRLW